MVMRRGTTPIWLALSLMVAACAAEAPGPLDEDESPSDEDDQDDDEQDDDEQDDDEQDDDEDDDDSSNDRADASADAGRNDSSIRPVDAGTASDGGSDAAQDAARRDSAIRDAAADATSPATPGDGGATSTGDVPSGEHCAPVATWDMQAAQFEQQVLELTNAARAKGHNCDTKGMFGPTGPLTMQPLLRCSARLHSKYMAENREFSHDQAKTGLNPAARIRATGYVATTYGENIAWGQRTPQEVVNGWLDSDGHCANMMSPNFNEIGIGYMLGLPPASGGGGGGTRQAAYWTQNFGRKR